MIDKKFGDINCDTDEEKMLFAALAILTSIECDEILSGKYGGHSYIHDVLDHIREVSNKTFYPEEYEIYEKKVIRNKKINDLLNG
jgi:hypothetical protein